MPQRPEDPGRSKAPDATREGPARPARAGPPAEESAKLRLGAPSTLQGVLPADRWQEGVRLNELPDEPVLPDLKQGADRYSVHGLLGEGGMGKVYLAFDEDLGRPVALKMSRQSDPEHLARFVAEAQIMGQLRHPGIVPVLEIGRSRDARLYYSMPVVHGQTLDAVVEALRAEEPAAVSSWSLTRLVQAFLQTCQAVAYAHAKGVVHRDLKPSNIMVGRHGEVQVLDWGVAKIVREGDIEVGTRLSPATERGVAVGTPDYMSPEQLRGEAVDQRSDVYSLGAILYELLTLRRPFEDSPTDDFTAPLCEEPPPPRRVAPLREIPRVLERACRAALEKRPARRPQSVRQLADEVQLWLEAEADRARRRQLAAANTEESESLLAEHARLRDEVARLEVEERELARCTEGWRPIADKRELFATQDRLEDARGSLVETSARALATLHAALAFDPEHRPARELLSDYFLGRVREAEAEGRSGDVRFYADLTASYHDGRHARELSGVGSLELESDPPGAEAWLHELVEEDLVLQPSRGRYVGAAPLAKMELPMGSYLVVLRKAGFRETRCPVFISRNKAWRGKVTLFRDEEIGRGFAHVPAGPFLVGGDPECRGWELPAGEPVVDDFRLAIHPVTNREYLEYLNELVATEGLPAAIARSSRHLPDDPSTSYFVERNGRLELPEAETEEDAWLPGYPVTCISWHDAAAYCTWRGEREGRDLRLPTELEWEKAARGVDGRAFPWGSRFDPSCCNMRSSRRAGEAAMVPVETVEDRYPADVSVYGACGLAGNTRDWTATHGDGDSDTRVIRGGCWSVSSAGARCANRFLGGPHFVHGEVGFRLAATLRREKD